MSDVQLATRARHQTSAERKTLLVAGAAAGMSATFADGLAGCIIAGLLPGVLSALLTMAVYASEDACQHLPIHWMWWPAIGGLVIEIPFVREVLRANIVAIEADGEPVDPRSSRDRLKALIHTAVVTGSAPVQKKTAGISAGRFSLIGERLSTTPGGVCHACTSRPRPYGGARETQAWSLEAFLWRRALQLRR